MFCFVKRWLLLFLILQWMHLESLFDMKILILSCQTLFGTVWALFVKKTCWFSCLHWNENKILILSWKLVAFLYYNDEECFMFKEPLAEEKKHSIFYSTLKQKLKVLKSFWYDHFKECLYGKLKHTFFHPHWNIVVLQFFDVIIQYENLEWFIVLKNV